MILCKRSKWKKNPEMASENLNSKSSENSFCPPMKMSEIFNFQNKTEHIGYENAYCSLLLQEEQGIIITSSAAVPGWSSNTFFTESFLLVEKN